MKFGGILGVTVIVVPLFLSQWPKLKKNEKKVRITFFSLVLVNWIPAVLLVIDSDMPGTGQLIDFIYQSFEPLW